MLFIATNCGQEETKQKENSIYGTWQLTKRQHVLPSSTQIIENGEIDGYGNKIQLWIISLVNLFLLLTIYLVAKFPKYWNIPFKPKNLVVFQKNVRVFMGILSILLSCAISTMILFTLKYSATEMLRLLFSILILPMLFVVLFNEKADSK